MGVAHDLLGQRKCPGQFGFGAQRFTKAAEVISPLAVFIADYEDTAVASKS
jgi:hypothetical protein